MKFTTRSRYGTQLLIDVALHEEDGPVSLRDVSERFGISVKYLEKISRALREAGYLESIAGARGGYRLKVHPSSIRMGDVAFLLETGEHSLASLKKDTSPCNCKNGCTIRNLWTRAIFAMRDELNTVSLEELLRDACFCPDTPCIARTVYGVTHQHPTKE